jgi:hypothetical protein
MEPHTLPPAPTSSTLAGADDDDPVLDLADQTMRPSNNAIQQQRIEAWHPVLDPEWVIYAFLILAVIFIPTGT